MKRYTDEFISDTIKRHKEWNTPSAALDDAIERLERIRRTCKRGLMTDTEAIIETLKAMHYIE